MHPAFFLLFTPSKAYRVFLIQMHLRQGKITFSEKT
jgi:hypothetical protein